MSKKEEVKQKAQEPIRIARWERWAMKISWVHAIIGIMYYTGLGALLLELFL